MAVAAIPPINLARRLIAKLSLAPPINVKSLVEAHADLTITNIPIEGVDGISLDLKTPGKKARVVLNANNPQTRQRFTLAHELGHLLIPWHTGNIVDHVDPTLVHATDNYWEFESEANAFAGELLMPSQWVTQLLAETDNIAQLHKRIARESEVSLHAAAIRLTQLLPKNLVFAVERDGAVEFSGRTEDTLANTLPWKSEFPDEAYDYCDEHYMATSENRRIHWWKLPNSVVLAAIDERPWREILNSIVADLGITPSEQIKIKSSINGVVAYANSAAKRSREYSVETVVAACVQRFSDRPEFQEFVHHPHFHAFILQKAHEMIEPDR
ncbi:MAG: ImmA/IrrE family metallo-endopeptidase [Gallionella sp.]|jgi:hypothetical protein